MALPCTHPLWEGNPVFCPKISPSPKVTSFYHDGNMMVRVQIQRPRSFLQKIRYSTVQSPASLQYSVGFYEAHDSVLYDLPSLSGVVFVFLQSVVPLLSCALTASFAVSVHSSVLCDHLRRISPSSEIVVKTLVRVTYMV